MSWTYSGSPASSKMDECRFTLGDTVESEPIMQDEEIQYLIDTYGSSPNQLMYQLFSKAATIFARDIKRSLGSQSEDPTERLKYFNERAAVYKTKLVSSGLSLPTYAYPKVFSKGMQNNPPWSALNGGSRYV